MSEKLTWDKYYQDRVNNKEYLLAFRRKYMRFLIEIVDNVIDLSISINSPVVIKEEGCGIGNVSKCVFCSLSDYVSSMMFSDINKNMLSLCMDNTRGIHPDVSYYIENICAPKFFLPSTCVITHGVLEHFDDRYIKEIMSTYDDKRVVMQAHYVPTDAYKIKSFGDERLLPVQYWVDLVKPDYCILDNGGCDLYMFKKQLKNKE